MRRTALMFLLASLVASGGTLVAAERPNILFLFADDMRPDCISALGNPQIRTPNLDKIVERGLTFTRATCSYPICVVSRAELLNGRHGWEIGVDRNGRITGDPAAVDWAEALRRSGYNTWHVGKWHVSGRPSNRGYTDSAALFGSGGSEYWKEGQLDWKGFPITGYRGWIFQNDDRSEMYPELGVGVTPDISAKFADAAIGIIGPHSDKPWFCHVNFTAPHDPLLIPPGMEGKYSAKDIPLPENFLPVHPLDHGNFDGRDEALLAWPRTEEAVRDLLRVYYSVIEDMDAQIGRILEALEASGQLENTIIIFTSDHGMACGSHGLRGKQNMYEHTINVPLVMAGPSVPAGEQTNAQIYLRELYPTTCELANVTVPESVTAESFARVIHDPRAAHHKEIFGYFKDTQRMVRTEDGWKLVHYPAISEWQLFDLNSDPLEMENLADSDEGVAKEQFDTLRKMILDWRSEKGDPLMGLSETHRQ